MIDMKPEVKRHLEAAGMTLFIVVGGPLSIVLVFFLLFALVGLVSFHPHIALILVGLAILIGVYQMVLANI